MGIDKPEPATEPAPAAADVPADEQSPTPRETETPGWFTDPTEAAPADPSIAVPVAQDTAHLADSVPVTAPTKDAAMSLVNGYVEALKREFSKLHEHAADHARAVLAELRIVDEEAFKAFASAEPKVAEYLGSANPK